MRKHASGLTLIELMVAMVISLVLMGGAISIALANAQSYRVNVALSEVQETYRTAYELLARDIRQAGATGCMQTDRIANVLNNGSHWWSSWQGLLGFDGATTAPAVGFGSEYGQRIPGTDALLLQGLRELGLSVQKHNVSSSGSAANFQITAPTEEFVAGDVLMVCDFNHAAIFQISNYNSSNQTVVFNTGGSQLPGNCSKGLGFPTDCTSPNGNPHEFGVNSSIGLFGSTTWYVGHNGRIADGGRSLFRVRLGRGGVSVTEEIVSGVTDLRFAYRVSGEAQYVADPPSFDAVDSIRMTMSVLSATSNITTQPNINDGRISRDFTSVITLRNRVE